MEVNINNIEINDLKKLLPTHLIPNEILLKMEKDKYFGSNFEIKNNPQTSIQIDTSNDKCKEFISILKEDLRKMIDKNISLSIDITEIEEERQYYLGKLINLKNFCNNNIDKADTSEETKSIMSDILKVLFHTPEDFK
jgi:hypothetical protein